MTAAQQGHQGIFIASRLETVFQRCFARPYRTCLVGGAAEPLYQPAAGEGDWHRIYYREDYFASALHEVAHWCIAGPQRRKLVDFGYWYAPDGRSAAQQAAFEKLETRPQALECYFARACGYPFRVSSDNIEAGPDATDSSAFRDAVFRQCLDYQRRGLPGSALPARALCFYRALSAGFGSGAAPAELQFRRADFDR